MVHADVPEYQVKNMNINTLKDNLRKRRTSVWYKKNLDERLLTALKEKAPLYVDGEVLKRINKIEKKDTSMNYYPKIAY